MKTKHIFIALLSIILVSSCEKESTVSTSADTMIASFNLVQNDSISYGLNQYFFTIDLRGGNIYNADSLPVGTRISSLKVEAKCSFDTKIQVIQNNDTTDYSEKTAINFTKEVYFLVTAPNKKTQQKYRVKVNVHQLVPDSLVWQELAMGNFPTDGATLIDQKTVLWNNQTTSLMQLSSGYYLAKPTSSGWNRSAAITFAQAPIISTFQIMGDTAYIIGQDRNIYHSLNGTNWTPFWSEAGSEAISLIGVLNTPTPILTGILKKNNAYYHFTIQNGVLSTKEIIDDQFPISGQSSPLYFTTAGLPQMAIACGQMANGDLTNGIWAYDGNQWAEMNANTSRPIFKPRQGAGFFAYKTEQDVVYTSWFLMGGVDDQGNYLKEVYVSKDFGIVWENARKTMQWPDIEGFYPRAFASTLVLNRSQIAPAAAIRWQAPRVSEQPMGQLMKTRSYNPEKAPYMYMFGGKTSIEGQTVYLDQIWRGVINRMIFKPIE